MNTNPGILPYNLGKAFKTSNQWTFIQIFELNIVINEFNELKNKFNLLKNAFNTTNDYMNEFRNSYIIINNLETKIDEQISQILPKNPIRHKRGLINGLGSIIKSITGNLDQSDAERIDSNINILKENQNDLKIVLNNQMSILEKSINTFRDTIKNISLNQDILKTKIYQTIKIIENVELKQTTISEVLQVHMILSQIALFYQNIYNILERIETAITFAKLRTFHNAIMNPEYLLTEMQLISKHLINEKLPFKPIKENMLNIENCLEIKSYIKDQQVIFIIEIPLVSKTPYELYQLYSLPVLRENKFQMIVPNFNYLLINDYNFGIFNEKCNEIVSNQYLCKNIHIQKFNNDNIPCEVQLFKYNKNITNCKITFVDIDFDIQNINHNTYILVSKHEVIATETCKEHINRIIFKGTHLIELNKDCELKIKDIVLKSYTNSVTSFQMIPLPNIVLNVNESKHKPIYDNVKLFNLNNIHLNKIDDLQKQINIQKENNDLFLKPIHFNTISIWTILLYIILILIFLYICKRYLWPKISNYFIKNKRNQNIHLNNEITI